MELSPSQQQFVLHWGEMGSRWGVNRTVAQIHALLFIVERPLNADEIAETLAVARSNVSTSLRELQSWGIIKVVPILGERKDHFTCDMDMWEMMRLIVEQRKQRELDPTVAALETCMVAAKAEKGDGRYTRARLQEAIEFFQRISGWYEQLNKLDTENVKMYLSVGAKAVKVLPKGKGRRAGEAAE